MNEMWRAVSRQLPLRRCARQGTAAKMIGCLENLCRAEACQLEIPLDGDIRVVLKDEEALTPQVGPVLAAAASLSGMCGPFCCARQPQLRERVDVRFIYNPLRILGWGQRADIDRGWPRRLRKCENAASSHRQHCTERSICARMRKDQFENSSRSLACQGSVCGEVRHRHDDDGSQQEH